MRKRKSVLTTVLLACLTALPHMAAQDVPAASKKGLFWKATSGGNTIYMLGSIHIGSKDMYPLPQEIEDGFAASTTLIVEVDIEKVDKEKMQAMMVSKGMYAGDDSLWDHVSSETRKQVEQFCGKYQLPAAGFARLKPWAVAIAAALIPMMKAGLDPNLGIDKHFLDKVNQGSQKKTVVEIESAEWQLNLLSGFSEELQGKLLASALEQSNKPLEDGKKIEDLWMSGDAARLEVALNEGLNPPEIRRALVEDRNPHMADVAEQYLKGKEPAFLVVGAAHLIGKDGVVSLLQKHGYQIDQVTLAEQPFQEVHMIAASEADDEKKLTAALDDFNNAIAKGGCPLCIYHLWKTRGQQAGPINYLWISNWPGRATYMEAHTSAEYNAATNRHPEIGPIVPPDL